jgi:hypothetical protein
VSLFGLRRSAGLAAAALLLGLVTAGCGAAGQANPEKIGPRGVDELVIPTPDPDPDDFVDAVTNPWLPLAPGTTWTYDVAGSEVQQLEVRVEDRRKVVAGVSCVVVHHTGTDRDGEVVVDGDAFYAQDTRGNVWLFGEESRGLVPTTRGLTRSWSADENGAEPGVAMLSTPRVGDGYTRALAPSASDRSTIVAIDEERTVPAGTFGGLLLVEDSLDYVSDDPGPVIRRAYAEGTGLVEETTMSGGTQRLVLRSVVEPPAAG